MSNEPLAWLYTAAHEPWNRHLEWVENASGYRGDWIKTPLHTQDDTALLRQALEALELLEDYDNAQGMLTEEAIERVQEIADSARASLRERLGEKA